MVLIIQYQPPQFKLKKIYTFFIIGLQNFNKPFIVLLYRITCIHI